MCVQCCPCKQNREKLLCDHRFVHRFQREKTGKPFYSEIPLQRPGEMPLGAWTPISDKISQGAFYQSRCCRTYNLDKDPGMERRMKAGSCLGTASLLKHTDIVDIKLSLLNCELILFLHKCCSISELTSSFFSKRLGQNCSYF